jgi:hypothetical protein
LVPSLEEVMPRQVSEAPTDVSSVQVIEAFVGAIAINVKNKVRNKRYLFDAARGVFLQFWKTFISFGGGIVPGDGGGGEK